jgi:flagellar hook-associated protein 1 FlgK
MSVSRIFDIATRSMAVYQNALAVTSNNISNSANPDYSRQLINLKSATPQVLGGFVWGTGVTIQDITRARDQFTDNQIRTNNPKNAESNLRSSTMSQIENVFSEPSDLGISSLMNNFFNSWQNLDVTPNSASLRQNVLQSAQQLSNKVQDVYSSLTQTKSDILDDLKVKTTTLNNDLNQVLSLNQQIFRLQGTGQIPNDLFDQRDKVIDDLSKLANITVNYDNTNSASISVGGVFGVDKENVHEFSITENNGQINLVSGTSKVNAVLNSGEFFADADIYSNKIPQYQNALNQIFSTFTDQVNSVHQSGYNIENPPETSIKFFEGYNDGVLAINKALVSDPNKIAVSSDGTAGNGDIGVQIANLSNKALLNGSSLQDNYSSLISQIGNEKNSADQSAQSTSMILQQLNSQKSSYSGVSVDEEMSNILQYQRSYEASAKMITIANEMLQTIIQMVT